MRPASRMSHLSPHFFATLKERISNLEAQGKEIFRLDEGAPDLPPADHIIAALTESANKPDAHGYQSHRGPTSLREAWVEWYDRQYRVALDRDSHIVPLLGSKEGIFHLSLALLQAGDIALVPDPGYVSYTRGALFAGAEVFPFPLIFEKGYLPELRDIPKEVLEKTKIMWLNYPNNPTGACAPIELFEEAVELAKRYGFLVCHDAAYSMVFFNKDKPPSLLQVPGALEVGVEFNTLSKSHNMAGWRTGALIGNPQVVRTFFTLKTNADSSHFLPIFKATEAALTSDQTWLEGRNRVYRERRDEVLSGLRAAGLDVKTPQGSLYVWSPIPPGWKSESFCLAALENTGVSITPGTVFGEGGEGFVRIALTVPIESIKTAMARLVDWMKAHGT